MVIWSRFQGMAPIELTLIYDSHLKDSNKPWDATRHSGLVRFRFAQSHPHRSQVIGGGRLHPL
jgi:hypothetical protein